MKIKEEVFYTKMIPKHILPYAAKEYVDNMMYPTKIYTIEGVNHDKVVYYFAGSGTNTHVDGFLAQSILEKGYALVSTLPPVLIDTLDPAWVNGYGNQNSPNFLGYSITDGWMVCNAVNSHFKFAEKVIVGQSRGATAIITYLAGVCGEPEIYEYGLIKGVFCNGASIASLSDDAWVNTEKTIRTMGDVINWSFNSGVKRYLHYGKADTFLTPEMLDKVLLMLPKKDKNLEFLTSHLPHVWMNKTKEGADYVAEQVDNIFKGNKVKPPSKPKPIFPRN